MSALVTGVQTCALPISVQGGHSDRALKRTAGLRLGGGTARTGQPYCRSRAGGTPMGRLSAPRTLVVTHGPRAEGPGRAFRSEEHTSELQSLMRISYAVFCLKKKNKITYI